MPLLPCCATLHGEKHQASGRDWAAGQLNEEQRLTLQRLGEGKGTGEQRLCVSVQERGRGSTCNSGEGESKERRGA